MRTDRQLVACGKLFGREGTEFILCIVKQHLEYCLKTEVLMEELAA